MCIVFTTQSQASFHRHLHPSFTFFYLPYSPLPMVITILLSVARFFFLLNPFTFFTQAPTPLWQLSVCSLYQWVCFCFVCKFILLDSTYKYFLDNSHSNTCEVIVDLIGNAFMINDVGHLFRYLLSIWVSSLEKYVLSSALCAFLILLLLLVVWVLQTFFTLTPCQVIICKDFLSFLSLPFHFCFVSFTEAF